MEKLASLSSNTIGESTFVNMNTEPNITFSKGFVVSKSIRYRPIKEQEGAPEILREKL